MARLTTALGMALVAMLYVVFCSTTPATAGFIPRSSRHAHRGIRRALMVKRADADCPESNNTLGSYVQGQIKKLSSASAQQGGREQVKEVDLPSGNGVQHVKVKAKSDQTGPSRSWSWSWSSHSSTTKSTSTTKTTHTSWSSSDHSDSSSASTDDGSMQQDQPHDHQNEEQVKRDSQPQKPAQQPAPKQPQPQPQPQPVVVHTEDHSTHTHHTSDSTHQETTSTEDKDGKITKHTSSTKSHSSSSSSSYSHSMNVFRYVISGNTEKSDNAAPFANGQVQWTRSPATDAELSVSPAVGQPLSRPAKAETCNRRFPFNNQQYTANDKDDRFSTPFPQEALDPVSKTALDLHNAERARYGLQPLQWNVELANMAACWADLKAYGHSEDHFCASGENIAMGLGDPCYSNPMEGMKNAVMSFLDEDRNWARNPHLAEDDGHWTQIVWKDTRFVGCAVSQRKDFMEGYSPNDNKASMYVVCEYYPPGNVVGQFDKQVPAVRPMPQLRSTCSANERHGG